jgi:hypothetical protein
MPLTRVLSSCPGYAALWFVVAAMGCGSGQEFSGPLPSPDGELFVREVYPLLLRDCAFAGCHGVPERFFHLYGPGRRRMPAELDYTDPATLDEVLHSYDRTVSMLVSAEDIEDSLLLQKPLEEQAGGQGHKGVDDLGRNVFATKRDAGWKLLHRWANSRGAKPTAAQVSALNDAALAVEPEDTSDSEAAP